MPELPSMNFQGEEPQPKDYQTFGEYLEASKKFRAERLTERAEEVEEDEEEDEEELDFDIQVDTPS